MKKALFIGHYPNAVEPYLRSFFRGLIHSFAEMGIDCTVVAPVSITHYKNNIIKIPQKTYDFTPNGFRVKVYHPRYLSFSSKKIGLINTGYYSEKAFQQAALRCTLRLKGIFDFVYGHFFLTGGLAAVRIGRRLRIPSFIAYGECDYNSQVLDDYGAILTKDVDGLTGIISVSTQNTNELEELGIVPNIPILTAPNATDLSLFHNKDKAICREKLNLPQNVFIVGFVGGFIERKGDKRLLKAVNQMEDVYVAFAGKGNTPPTGEKVIFCQSLKHEDICDFLNAVDVFCLPTLSEGSCNAIVEAMACGAPVISSDLPFNDDVLNDNNSIRIDPTSIYEIQIAIEELKENRDKIDELHEASLRTAQEFSISSRAKKILAFIDSLS